MKPVVVITLLTLVALCVPLPVGAASRADVNNDGVVDVLDFTAFVSNKLAQVSRFDVINNGVVNIFDFNKLVALLIPASPTASPYPTAIPGSKPTKKWHPGHYVYHKTNNVDPQTIVDYYQDARYDATAGVFVQAYWKDLEAQKDQYTFNYIQRYLDVLPDDKQLIILFMDRDYQADGCGSSRLPGWVSSIKGAKGGCISKFWQQDVMDQEIELLAEIAKRFDTHPKFEGILLQETSWGAGEAGLSHEDVFEVYEQIHERSKDLFKQSHLFRMMNYLGGPAKSCNLLPQLANQLKSYGYGIGNPDSVAWDAIPWNCTGSNINGEITSGNNVDESKPIYSIYRSMGNSLPKLVGNDGSQLGNPNNPRMFNGERMTIPNLVKYHYLTAVKGYSHKDFGYVEPFGAHYLMWLSNFWSHDYANSNALQEEWDNEILDFINQPGHETNQTCPLNINCMQ